MIVWGHNQIELLPKLEFDLARGNHDTGHDWHYDHQNYNDNVMMTMMKMGQAWQKVHNGIVLTAEQPARKFQKSPARPIAPPPLQQNCQKDDNASMVTMAVMMLTIDANDDVDDDLEEQAAACAFFIHDLVSFGDDDAMMSMMRITDVIRGALKLESKKESGLSMMQP